MLAMYLAVEVDVHGLFSLGAPAGQTFDAFAAVLMASMLNLEV